MTTPDEAYAQLLCLYRERTLLESISTVLAWDEETYMPEGAVEQRAEQQALLAGLEHARARDPRLGELLALAEGATTGSAPERAVNLRELRREHEDAKKTPAALVEALARATTIAQSAWASARDSGDASDYLPALAEVVLRTQEWADCVRGEGSRYDACLDAWEPDLREAEILRMLEQLTPELARLAAQLEETGRADDALMRPVPVDAQRDICLEVVDWLGFDLARGRLDAASHPSTVQIGPGDVRLTTRYDPAQPFGSLLATLHEAGHGLYDQRLPREWYGTPVGEAPSVALHESQSRFVENVVGRSRGLLAFVLPKMRAAAQGAMDDVDLARVHAALHRVARTTQRIAADEVTYDLHIAVRVELERALLTGELRVGDLQHAWADRYARTLVRPDGAADGFLQDGHWAAGMFGYFPTYTMGNVVAAQLARSAESALGDLDALISGGQVRVLMDWLTAHVHRHGSLFSRAELVTRVCGEALDPGALVERLTRSYGPPGR